MKRSVTRERYASQLAPYFAALHPGYLISENRLKVKAAEGGKSRHV
jgi:hypothetical protein